MEKAFQESQWKIGLGVLATFGRYFQYCRDWNSALSTSRVS